MDAIVIEKEAMMLSEVQRAALAGRLLESLSKLSPDLTDAWTHEASSRLNAYREGKISAVDGPQAIEELRSRFGA